MLGLILLVVVVLLVWQLSAGGRRFVQQFVQLIDRPVLLRSGLGAFLTGLHQVTGECEGREVKLELQEKRSRYSLPYLELRMESFSANTKLGDDTGAFQDSIEDREGKRALYDLAVKHEVTLKLDGKWLTATWMPAGIGLFPGRFDRERWRNVLSALRIVVRSLEEPSP